MKELDLVHVMPVSEFQDIVIAGNRFSELQNRTLSLEELCMHPLVSMESGTTTRLFWDNLFEEQGLDLHPSIEVSSNDLIAPTVSHNLGIGFVPSEFARNYLLNYRVFQLHLNIPIPKRPDPRLAKPDAPADAGGTGISGYAETAGAGKYREWTAGLVTPIGIFTKNTLSVGFYDPTGYFLFVIYKLLTSSYK